MFGFTVDGVVGVADRLTLWDANLPGEGDGGTVVVLVDNNHRQSGRASQSGAAFVCRCDDQPVKNKHTRHAFYKIVSHFSVFFVCFFRWSDLHVFILLQSQQERAGYERRKTFVANNRNVHCGWFVPLGENKSDTILLKIGRFIN